MLIQVLKQVKWFGLFYFVANNIAYQFLWKKYINEPQLSRRRRNRRVENSQEAPQNQPEVEEKSCRQSLLFVLLIGSWFMHNAISLYLLDFESCGRAIYDKFFKDHVEYIRANNHPIQTEFIKAFFCDGSQIVVALILLVCFFHKNYLLKALAFLVVYHFVYTYHGVKEAMIEKLKIEDITSKEENNLISNNEEYYQTATSSILDNPQEILAPEKEKSNIYVEEKIYEEVKSTKEEAHSGFYEPVEETNEDPEKKDCFKKLPWLAYIPLKTISLGLEIAFDAGEVFEFIVCKAIG